MTDKCFSVHETCCIYFILCSYNVHVVRNILLPIKNISLIMNISLFVIDTCSLLTMKDILLMVQKYLTNGKRYLTDDEEYPTDREISL